MDIKKDLVLIYSFTAIKLKENIFCTVQSLQDSNKNMHKSYCSNIDKM